MGMTPRTTQQKAATLATFRSTARLLSRLREGDDLTVDIAGDTAKILPARHYSAGPYRGTAHDLRVALEALLSAKLTNLALTVEHDMTAEEDATR